MRPHGHHFPAWSPLPFALIALIALGEGCVRPAALPLSATAPAAVPSAVATKTIYLTFDADMTPGMKARLLKKKVSAWYDQALIDELTSSDVPATIFMTGMFAEVYPDLVATLAKDGHFSIQNHTYDHSAFEWPCFGLVQLKTDEQKRTEIAKTQDILEKLTGTTPSYFRYPGLCRNAHDDAIVEGLGLTISDGTLISGDAFNRSADRIVRAVLARVTDGSVVVMHLGGPNAPSTAEAVRRLIPLLRMQGYGFGKL